MTGLLAFTVERVMELQVKRFISTNSRISKSSSAWQFFWATQNNYYTEADLGSENLKFLNFLTCKLSPIIFQVNIRYWKSGWKFKFFVQKAIVLSCIFGWMISWPKSTTMFLIIMSLIMEFSQTNFFLEYIVPKIFLIVMKLKIS